MERKPYTIPTALAEHIQEQQLHIIQVQELLEYLEDNETGAVSGPMGVAARALGAIVRALDHSVMETLTASPSVADDPPDRLNA